MAKQARGAGQPQFDLSSAVPLVSPYNVTYGVPATAGQAFSPAMSSQGIVRGSGSDWFGPLNPLAPIAPPDVAGRAFDIIPGFNLVQQPRAYEVVGFGLMRALADSYDVLRLVIETCKNQVARLQWTVRVTEDYAKKNKTIPAAKQAKIDAANLFFKSPDKRLIWRDWIRVLLEDLFVIDAPTLMKRLTRGGKLERLDLIAGDTIKPVIDDWGRTPEPYMKDGQLVVPPAFQQVLKGFPAVNYTKDQLIYKPYNRRSNRVYGYSQVEMVIITVNIALRREMFLLDYYREGNVPEAIFGAPDTWDANQIVMFQNWWDATLAGNLGARRRARFVPSGTGKSALWAKDPSTDNGNKLDEWLGRIICYAFNQSPQWLAQQMNRATADTAKESAGEEGIEPIKGWVLDLCNAVIQDPTSPFADPDIEFAFVEEEDTDPQVQDEILTNDLKAAGITLNQFREAKGQDPYDDPAADLPMVYTATGYVPFDINVPGSESQQKRSAFQLDQQSQQMDLQSQYEPDNDQGSQEDDEEGSSEGVGGSDGEAAKALSGAGRQDLQKVGWTDEAREASAAARHVAIAQSLKSIGYKSRKPRFGLAGEFASKEPFGTTNDKVSAALSGHGYASEKGGVLPGWRHPNGSLISMHNKAGGGHLLFVDDLDVKKLAKAEGPQTLYVRRRLLNAKNIIDWAKQQGFKTTLPEDDMHVTVVYSKTPVPWNAMPRQDANPLVVPGDHTREVKPLGDQGAVVLRFDSSKLNDRWQQHVDSGASHDFPSYQPHVTITWDAQGMEHDSIEPYDGPLVFGPEVREEIKGFDPKNVVEKVAGASRPVIASRQGLGGRPPHTPPRMNGARSPASIDDEVARRVKVIMKKLTEAA
jgi:hypothetical protein